MRYLSILFCMLFATVAMAQQPETITGRVELNDGKFVIESFTLRMVGDSIQVEMGDLKLINANSPTVNRFSVPVVFAVPVQTHRIRRRVDPLDYAGHIRVEVKKMEEREGELFIDMDVKMHGDVMNRRLSYLLIPELIGADGHSTTPAGLLVNGWGKDQLYRQRMAFQNTDLLENLPDIKIAVTNYTDTLVSYNMRLPYELWMDHAVLDIHQVLGSPAGKEQLYTIANAAKVTLQPIEPYLIDPRFNFLTPDREEKRRMMQGQAFLDFQVGRSVIVPDFRRNPQELAKIEGAIREVQRDADVQIVGLFVEGYASPEGSWTSNERLARERSQALADHISRNYGIASSLIRTSSVAEDWDGLRLLIDESAISRKQEILAIIDSGDEPDRKEQRLRALGAPWQTMLNTMFPQLRRVEYQIDFTVKDYSLEESREMAGRNPELLSQRELFLLAQTYESGSPEQEGLFETIIRLYPDDPVAILNYSSVLLHRGELAAAKRYLDRIEDDVHATNNLGVYWLLAGDTDQAAAYLHRAKAAGIPEADHNLEELRKKQENNSKIERYGQR